LTTSSVPTLPPEPPAVLDHDLLAEPLAELGGEDPRRDVGCRPPARRARSSGSGRVGHGSAAVPRSRVTQQQAGHQRRHHRETAPHPISSPLFARSILGTTALDPGKRSHRLRRCLFRHQEDVMPRLLFPSLDARRPAARRGPRWRRPSSPSARPRAPGPGLALPPFGCAGHRHRDRAPAAAGNQHLGRLGSAGVPGIHRVPGPASSGVVMPGKRARAQQRHGALGDGPTPT